MKGKLFLAGMWFILSIGMLVHNLYFLRVSQTIASNEIQSKTENVSIPITAPYPQSGKLLAAYVSPQDGRALLLEKFMKGTPLEPYAEYIVHKADFHQIDYRLVPAIAMCESNLGVHIPSFESHNAWGIAVYTGQTEGAEFSDWIHAIDWVTEFISKTFIDKDLIDIKVIGNIWAPPSVEKGNSWANCVESFMRQIE